MFGFKKKTDRKHDQIRYIHNSTMGEFTYCFKLRVKKHKIPNFNTIASLTFEGSNSILILLSKKYNLLFAKKQGHSWQQFYKYGKSLKNLPRKKFLPVCLAYSRTDSRIFIDGKQVYRNVDAPFWLFANHMTMTLGNTNFVGDIERFS